MPQKADRPIIAPCRLSDCLFFEGPIEGRPGYCLCSHPDKQLYLQKPTCPLYRLDWQKRMQKGNLS
ncbi:MAG: hypothetical protein Kow0059_09960 [Candidatus Sumerlaeia bacterium]